MSVMTGGIVQRPTKPCYVCGSSDWWLAPWGEYLCGKCHPNPNPDYNPSSRNEKYSPEVLALRDRVIKGNDKLFRVRFQIQEMEEGEEKECQWDRWNEAQEKLRFLCSELKANYSDCLYLDENGNRTKSCLGEGTWWCEACPSTRKYWVEELMALPGPGKE